MACKSKTELINAAVKEFLKLNTLIAPLDDVQAGHGADGTSIKDVIGHRAHWIDLFLGWYSDGMAGKKVFFPAKGYKWNDLKRYNADLRRQQKSLNWDAARNLLNERHRQLVHFLTTKSAADLYSGPMQGANNTWTPGRWAEAAGPSHYRSAAKFVRSVLRTKN